MHAHARPALPPRPPCTTLLMDRSLLPLPLDPGVRRGWIVTRLVVEFAVGPGRRVEVHVVAGGLQPQVHVDVGGSRGALVHLVFKESLLKVPVGVLKDGVRLVVLPGAVLGNRLGRDLGTTGGG